MQQKQTNWVYRRCTRSIGIEVSDWYGSSSPSLSAHFHSETQISVVLKGIRSFQIGKQSFQISAGKFAVIPAGTPHRSLGSGGIQTHSRDLFVDPTQIAICEHSSIWFGSVLDVAPCDADSTIEDVIHQFDKNKVIGEKLRLAESWPSEIVEAVCETAAPISEIAGLTPLSREGFIRKFARGTGMTPHAYRIAYRACQARSMLRMNLPPALVAVDSGFSDQSHLGRVFQRNFGTTPAAYRRAWLG